MARFGALPIARALVVTPFVLSGIGYFRDRKAREGMVRGLGYPQPEVAALLDGVVKVGGGLLLSAGVLPRLAAAALVTDLGAMSFSLHAFWKESDPEARFRERNSFVLNGAVAGGLVAAAIAGGRPKR